MWVGALTVELMTSTARATPTTPTTTTILPIRNPSPPKNPSPHKHLNPHKKSDPKTDITLTCTPDYPVGYCVTEGLSYGNGPDNVKRMLKPHIVGDPNQLTMNCIGIKSKVMFCCPPDSIRWIAKDLTDADIEGICGQYPPVGL
ncbi:hypothetical protein PCANC_10828 [Puccinia coronata f. sp. avenae]|uniref:Hydrophobin n=1 Tax=Puccinia coronata f. sp. avenae TaxID=200324 RepID=A0A2N5V0V3_9BASI|nr:hypothetical protein PCASD_23634 [Puccinia coronata f. sp. avenae]PLW18708.1 hypothetical protein PCANC_12545 [Puccinia coronata f. sp. avenae]PLW43623.1 hypothetical protein PCANC_10828 [Puccinia coronata f. sp. avenae]